MTEQPSCDVRIDKELEERLEDIKELWENYCSGDEDKATEWYEYGLCFDYVNPGTFGNERGYFRWQLSTGGPGDEFNFYVDCDDIPYKITYCFIDWYEITRRASILPSLVIRASVIPSA